MYNWYCIPNCKAQWKVPLCLFRRHSIQTPPLILTSTYPSFSSVPSITFFLLWVLSLLVSCPRCKFAVFVTMDEYLSNTTAGGIHYFTLFWSLIFSPDFLLCAFGQCANVPPSPNLSNQPTTCVFFMSCFISAHDSNQYLCVAIFPRPSLTGWSSSTYVAYTTIYQGN